jgi:hypothetical protein
LVFHAKLLQVPVMQLLGSLQWEFVNIELMLNVKLGLLLMVVLLVSLMLMLKMLPPKNVLAQLPNQMVKLIVLVLPPLLVQLV